ncbi:MAG: 50S ribosomal protein L32 [Parcubacteria group bacterium]|nr:50S ribosomal protein L32 [Parcubacteria group bacterium]
MVIRMRSTRSHTANRRSHHRLKSMSFSVCPDCKKPKENHKACGNCGKYNGRVVTDVHAKMAKKAAKNKDKDKKTEGK